MNSATRVIALVVFTVFAFVSSARPVGEQEKSCAVVEQALADYSKLKVGMKRSDVEKAFELSGGMNFRLTTRYMYPKCEYIHTDIEFDADGTPPTYPFSPNDVVTKIGPLYIRYAVKD